jgi:ubiquinone/menaquinone biosynthesis C-methylase UbiE
MRIRIKRGSKAFEAYGVGHAEESFSCNYELNPEYRSILERSGLVVSGVSSDGGARIVELAPNWFVGTGFLPQMSSESGKPHPLIVSFLKAALALKKLKTKGSERPESIENRWDILYRDYPEVYEEFASVPYSKNWIDVARTITGLRGKVVADIGSGTGKSTFLFARYAKEVIGIEPEDAMREVAVKNAQALGVGNVSFRNGWAASIPLEDSSVDMVVSVGGAFFHEAEGVRSFTHEAKRVTKPGGWILLFNLAPGWYGGELSQIVLGKRRTESNAPRILDGFGLKIRDYFATHDYGTVEKAVRTYGFIFGKSAIDYLRAHQKTTIKWKWRVHYMQV